MSLNVEPNLLSQGRWAPPLHSDLPQGALVHMMGGTAVRLLLFKDHLLGGMGDLALRLHLGSGCMCGAHQPCCRT